MKLISVAALDNYELELGYDNDEKRIFDVKPYLGFGIFTELKNEAYFKKVVTRFDGIAWQNGQDFSPETLYIKSISVPNSATP